MTRKNMVSDCEGIESAGGHSVTQWINRLKGQSDGRAAQQIWNRYAARLIRLACKKLQGSRPEVGDEHDVVAEAFAQFFSRARRGAFSKLDDRDDLWQILVMLTERRAIDLWRRGNREFRNRRVLAGSSQASNSRRKRASLDEFPDSQPTPAMAALIVDEFQAKLRALNDETLKQIALKKMEGRSNQEIAALLDLGLRSVERKLSLIRKIWMHPATGKESGSAHE